MEIPHRSQGRDSMVDRSQFIRMLVLNEVSDDYESFAHISEGVIPFGGQHGVEISSSEVRQAIVELCRQGLVMAVDLFSNPPIDVTGEMSDEVVDKHYFGQTDKGRAVHQSWPDDWPPRVGD